MQVFKILQVYPLEKMVLGVLFENGVFKKYDLAKLVAEIPAFKQLRQRKLFLKAKVAFGGCGVRWNRELDLSEDELYRHGKVWPNPPAGDWPLLKIIEDFKQLRHKAQLTQEEMARRTGIKQSCIARMENGGRRPNLVTLLRLGQALGCTLQWVPRS